MHGGDTDLMLIPRPRRLTRLSGWVTLPRDTAGKLSVAGDLELARMCLPGVSLHAAAEGDAGWLRLSAETAADGPGLSCDDQRYYLRIAEPEAGTPGVAGSTVNIRAATRAGLRHGLMTLRQLLRGATAAGGRLPCVEIEDGPSFATRGVMLDVSRCRVPTMDQLFLTVEMLAELKVNHLQLYTEHTFAYAGHEAVWRGWSPMTADEVRRLDGFCRARGIDLAANQNCFGHLAHWLRMPRYAPLAETHGDWVFDVWPRSGPFSLCPVDAGSLALVQDLLGQLLPCFTSRLVNIGCDETFDVGFGRSKAEVEKRGRAAVYLEFVAKIAAEARRLGKRPMFWADIALSHPACVKDVPEGMVSLAWGYEPDAKFAEWCRAIQGEAWVCPGTSSWRSIAGRTTERTRNIEAAAKQGVEGGAAGMLMCDWGDTGHHQQWPVAALGIAHGAHGAWNAEAAGEFDARAAAVHVLGDVSGESGTWLEGLGDIDLPLREVALGLSRPGVSGRLRNQGALFADLHNCAWSACTDVGSVAEWTRARDRVEEARGDLPTALPPLVEDELRHTADVMMFAADRAVARRQREGHGGARLDLRQRLIDLIAEHRRLWLRRSRPGGLEQSVGYYQKVRDDLAAT